MGESHIKEKEDTDGVDSRGEIAAIGMSWRHVFADDVCGVGEGFHSSVEAAHGDGDVEGVDNAEVGDAAGDGLLAKGGFAGSGCELDMGILAQGGVGVAAE
mgnify:CR=1 FL=1